MEVDLKLHPTPRKPAEMMEEGSPASIQVHRTELLDKVLLTDISHSIKMA